MSTQLSHISITLNGESYSLDGDPHLSSLIERLDMKPSRIAVELNRQIVPKAKYAETELRDGDQLEIINLVGGG